MAKRILRSAAGQIAPLYFCLGAFSLVFQTILLREFFTVAAGNEISFAIALASWLLGVGAGSLLAGFLSARPRRWADPLPWALVAICLSAPFLLAAARCLQRLSAVPIGALIPLSKTFWLVPLLTIPFSFFSGFAFPQAARLETASSLSAGRKIVRAYVWECIGALAGGLLYTFWLLEKLKPALIISLFTLPLLTGSTAMVSRQKRKRTLAVLCLLLAFNLYAIFAGGAGRLDSWLTRQRWQGLSTATWVEGRDSKFQNLQLGLNRGQFCLYSNGQLATIFPDDDQQAIQAAQIITQHPRPQRVLVIGEGVSGLARRLLQYRITSLTAVEIDGELLDLIFTHLPAVDQERLNDPRLRMPVMDGRRFVREAAGAKSAPGNRFDLVYLHQPDAWTALLNRYYTKEFFTDLRAILNEGGVVTMRLSSAEDYASEITNPYTATVYQTLKSVFPAIAVSPGQVNFISASPLPGRASSSPAVLAGRYAQLAQSTAGLEAIFASLYPAEKTSFIQAALDRYPVASLNRDQRPIAYFLCGRLLGWSSGSPVSGMFDFFEKMKYGTLFGVTALLLGLAVAVSSWRRRRMAGNFPLLLAAAGGGFAGLAFEILTIFFFQNIWGFVYRAIGLLIASFMLGMGAGAALAGRYLERKQTAAKGARKILAAIQLLIAGACAAFLPLMNVFARMKGPSGQVPLFFWLGGIGLLIGAILPLGMHICGGTGTATKAGVLNAADYLGGTIGALVTASFLLPLYGSAKSLLLIALPALAAALSLLLDSGFSGPGPARPSH